VADPVRPKVIGVKVAAANIGEFVIIRNLTRGGKLTDKLTGTDRSVTLTPAPTIQWEEGDLIQGEIRGRLKGITQKKISKGGIREILIVGSTDTATSEVLL